MPDIVVSFGGDLTELEAKIRETGRAGQKAAKAVQAPMDAIISGSAGASRMVSAFNGKLLAMGAVGAASVYAIHEAIQKTVEQGGRLTDLSKRTGELAGNLSILERTFKNTGSSAERIGPILNKMQATISAAAEGSQSAVDALARLGLTADDLKGKLPLEQLRLIARELDDVHDPAARSAAAMGLFGRGGGELLPMLSDFTSELAAAQDQLGSMPGILNESAGEFDQMGDSIDALHEKITELATGFMSELVPAINESIDEMSGFDAAGLGKKVAHEFTDIGLLERQIKTSGKLRDFFDSFAGPGEGTELGRMYQDEIDTLQAKLASKTAARDKRLAEQKAKAAARPAPTDDDGGGIGGKKAEDPILTHMVFRQGMEMLGNYTEREKLELQLEHAEERYSHLADSKMASEKDVNAALLDQEKIKLDLRALDRREKEASRATDATIRSRNTLDQSALDQQRAKVEMMEEEAVLDREKARTQDEILAAEQKLTDAASERLKLKTDERKEEERIKDIQFQRSQMGIRDPYKKATAALDHEREKAAEVFGRPGASEFEKAQAAFNVAQAHMQVVDAAGGSTPSLDDVAASGPRERAAARRAIYGNRNIGDAARAQRAQARLAYAQKLEADTPGSKEAAKQRKMARRAMLQAVDLSPDTMTDGEREYWDGLSDQEFAEAKDDLALRTKQKRDRKEEKAARDPKLTESRLDRMKSGSGEKVGKDTKFPGLDKHAEMQRDEPVPPSKEAPAPAGSDENKGPDSILSSIDATAKSIDKKLPLYLTN